MAMPSEDRLLLLTTQAQLFSVPFASAVASASTFVSIKPVNLRVGGEQTVVPRIGYSANPFKLHCAPGSPRMHVCHGLRPSLQPLGGAG